MKIVFFGTPQFAVPSLKRLLAHPDFEVVAIVTQPDKRRGRGGKVTPSPVKAAAVAAIAANNPLTCPIWQPQRIKKDIETLDQLSALGADAFVVIAYGQLLSQAMLDMPRLGCVNAHGSILPAYRGAAPIQWCLYHGEVETGVTTMLMDAGMDTGPMLMEETVPIGPMDNAWQVAEKLAVLSADLLPTTLQKLQQQMIRPVPQDDARASYAPLIQKADYALDWTKPAKALHNQVRGFYPNCVTQFRERSLKVMATVPLGADNETQPVDQSVDQMSDFLAAARSLYQSTPISPNQAPGTIVAILKNYGPVIQTGSAHLLLHEVKPAGKSHLSGWDFANGGRLEIGEQLS